LVEAGVIRRELDGVRILAKGELTEKLDFEVAGMSQAAQDAVAKLGGKVSILTPPKDEADEKPKKAKKAAEPKAAASEEEAPAEDAPAEDAPAEEASEDEASEE
jgi:large subunit ribosomal protein L15